MSRERTGVLVIRVWTDGEPPTVRARITHRSDVTGPDQTVTFASTVDDINAAVASWLQAFLDEQAS